MSDHPQTRPETGTMRFDGDWTGVFVRGDNALLYYAPAVERALSALRDKNIASDAPNFADRAAFLAVESLLSLLRSCDDASTAPPANNLAPFDRCKVTP